MIPDFLLEYKTELEKHSRNSILISEDELGTLTNDQTALTQSKYLGNFFIPDGMEYPKGKDDKVLLPTVQINFAEMPQLAHFPTDGLLQVFVPQHANFSKEEVVVQYISKEQLETSQIPGFYFLMENMYKNHFFKSIYKLTFQQDTSWASATDSQYKFRWDDIPEDETLAEYLEELSLDDEDKFDELFELFTGESMGSKLGGYGHFVHGDYRELRSELKDHILLLQIDGSDENVLSEEQHIYFHLFISKEDLQQKNFNNVIVDWQVTD